MGDERQERGRHHGHRSLDQRLDALEEEREKDNKWQKRASDRIGEHEARLDALELGVGLGGSVLRLTSSIEALTAALSRENTSTGRTNIHVVSVSNKEDTVSPITPDHMPDFTLPSSTEDAGLAVVGPKRANGQYATGGSFNASDLSESGAIELENLPDGIVEQTDPNWVDPDPAADPPNVAPMVPVLDDAGNQIPVYNVRVKTPLSPDAGSTASGLVTWTAPQMVPVDIKVIYGDPAFGHAAITARSIPDAVTP